MIYSIECDRSNTLSRTISILSIPPIKFVIYTSLRIARSFPATLSSLSVHIFETPPRPRDTQPRPGCPRPAPWGLTTLPFTGGHLACCLPPATVVPCRPVASFPLKAGPQGVSRSSAGDARSTVAPLRPRAARRSAVLSITTLPEAGAGRPPVRRAAGPSIRPLLSEFPPAARRAPATGHDTATTFLPAPPLDDRRLPRLGPGV